MPNNRSSDARTSKAETPAIQIRLQQIRENLGWTLPETAERVEAAAAEAGIRLPLYPVEVSRSEGTGGRPNKTLKIDYLRAFARAADVPLSEIWNEGVPGLSEEALHWAWRDISDAYRKRLALPARSEEVRRIDALRDKVGKALMLASGLPLPRRTVHPLGRLQHDVLAEIHADLQVLFWEAFYGRTEGVSDDDLISAAISFGQLLPSPMKLPEQAFLTLKEAGEDRLRRWWVLQAEALRCLIRENTFTPERMNLGRGGRCDDLPEWATHVQLSTYSRHWQDADAIKQMVEQHAAKREAFQRGVEQRQRDAEQKSPKGTRKLTPAIYKLSDQAELMLGRDLTIDDLTGEAKTKVLLLQAMEEDEAPPGETED